MQRFVVRGILGSTHLLFLRCTSVNVALMPVSVVLGLIPISVLGCIYAISIIKIYVGRGMSKPGTLRITCICVYMRVYACICGIWAYMSVYACICVYMRLYAYTCVYMRVYACICVYMRVYACICVYMCVSAIKCIRILFWVGVTLSGTRMAVEDCTWPYRRKGSKFI